MSTLPHPSRVKFSCPNCSHTASTLEINIGKQGRCRNCKHVFRIPEPTPLDISVNSTTITYRARKIKGFDSVTTVFSYLLPVVLFILSVAGLLKLASYLQDNQAILESIVYQFLGWIILLSPVSLPVLYFLLSVHKIRAARIILYYGCWLGLPLLMILNVTLVGLSTEGLFGLIAGFIFSVIVGIPWICFAHFPIRWILPYVLALLFWKMLCPHCHETHEFRDRWSCSCGYTDHRDDRHLLLFSCPKCQCHIGYMECPRCESTILV